MKRRAVGFPVAAVLLGLTASTAGLEILCRMLPVCDSLMTLPVNAGNPVTRFRENRNLTWSKGPWFSLVTKKRVNNYGFLNAQDYTPGDPTPLLAVIGDSYVEAAQVGDQATLQALLAKAAPGRGRVYSFGSSGSSLANYLAYARYATDSFQAGALVFIVVGNDFDESLTRYKNAPGFHYFSSASEALKLVRVDYIPTRFKRWARHSAFIRYLSLNLPWNWEALEGLFHPRKDSPPSYVGNTSAAADPKRVADSKKAVDRFLEELPLQTRLPGNRILMVLDGIRPELYDPLSSAAAQGSYFGLMRNYFQETAARHGYEVLDMHPAFVREHHATGQRFEFPSDGHWNEAGHRLVAEAIASSAVFKGGLGK